MKLRLVLFAVVLYGCSATPTNDSHSSFSAPKPTGLIDDRLPEASGLASSIANPGYMWSQNDGQNPAEVFLIDTTGQVKMVCKVPVDNRDWEEVAVGPGPEAGKTYVYVGEIGDNDAKYDTKYIYRFEEPIADSTEKNVTLTDTLKIQMSDGKRDTETMMIDPITNDLYLISKREDSVGVYKVAYPFTNKVMIAQKVGVIPFFKIVAGSFSKDGTEILLKDYDHIYYWKRSKDESLEQTLMRQPEELPYEREAQGEAITFNLDGSAYYTLSETNPAKPAYLKYYKRK
ncbi:MAG TPA: hypothetical protein VFE50_03645 [Cyclobacteriaceae bacterium]|nr:hypothetical protein [Cyclobacteriaceae bacterium]